MEKVTTENPRRISRREFLKAAGITAAAAGISQFASSKSQGLEKESVAPKVTSLPTVGHDVIFIPSPHQEPTPVVEENIVAEVKPVVAEAKPLIVEEEEKPPVAPKESGPENNLLSPEAFTPDAGMGGPETSGEEMLDYFPQSYKEASDGLKGLWSRAIDAKLRDKPQTNASLTIELATLPNKISFDYLLVPEGTKFFDIQEQNERILPCDNNVILLGNIEGEDSFLAIYQEPVNNCYYFAKVSKDALGESKDLTASKNIVVEGFNPALQSLKEIGTEEERKRLYEVKEGESLETIADRFGLPWQILYGKNLEIDPESLQPGLKLAIPDKYKEADFIEALTPDSNSITLSGEFFRKGIYFPEDALAIIEAFPDKKRQLDQRAVALSVAWMRNDDREILAQKRELYRDWHIFKFLAPGQERSFNNARAILAWHEVRFEMNPVLRKALDRLSEDSSLINKLIQEKVPVEVFQDNKYPSLPEDWHGIFVFALGDKLDLIGGLSTKNVPILLGAYDQYQEEEPGNEQILRMALDRYGLHEGIHAFIQPKSRAQFSPLRSTESPQYSDFIPADARRGLLAHMSMDILTSAAQRYDGFKEKRDPRIDYILKVLKQGEVEDPEAEVIRAAVTFNGDTLWKLYEQVRKENDLSMDSLWSTRKPDPTFWLAWARSLW